MKFIKNPMRYARGFTLIELLVVIAIIGILSSIVLASLSTARAKANDSKVQEQMSSFRSAAEIYNSTAGSYGVVASTTIATATTTTASVFGDVASGGVNIINGIGLTSGVSPANTRAAANGTYWVLEVSLPSGSGVWCVDSTGKSESMATLPAATALTLCP